MVTVDGDIHKGAAGPLAPRAHEGTHTGGEHAAEQASHETVSGEQRSLHAGSVMAIW